MHNADTHTYTQPAPLRRMNDFITKPFNRITLEEKILSLLGQRSGQDSLD